MKTKNTEVDFLNQPEVQEILKKVPVDENLLVKDLTFRNGVEEKIKEYFTKTSSKKDSKKSKESQRSKSMSTVRTASIDLNLFKDY